MNLANEKCNDERDLNFELTGFRFEGSVHGGPLCHSTKTDFGGITLKLGDVTTKTRQDGIFVFDNVSPGDHIIEVVNSKWSIDTKTCKFVMPFDNKKQHRAFAVTGFSIQGKVVESSGESVEGVSFLLYSRELEKLEGCEAITDGNFVGLVDEKQHGKPICSVKSQKDGNFHIHKVPCGQYTVVPYYTGSDSSKFDVVPNKLEVSVLSGPVTFDKPFVVKGFTLKGRVVNSKQVGIANVEITLPGTDYKTKTDKKGNFVIEQVSSGTYSISAFKTGFKFEIGRAYV